MSETVPLDDPVALTSWIETRYHARHREQLPRIVELARRVEATHAGHPRLPAGLAALLAELLGEIEVHMRKEELILFPAMRRGGMPGIENPIAVMRADHDDHAGAIARIRQLTENFTPPEDACASWRALYEKLAAFVAELEEHIRLENEVLFPRFEGVAAAG